MRRLTHAEYDTIVHDLLGDTTHPARKFVPDQAIGLFDNAVASQGAPVLLADQYVDAAVSLAEGVQDLNALIGCDPVGTAGAACVRGFIEKFGRRAYRRPLEPDEIAGLVALSETARAASDEATGVRAVLAAILGSPYFLFRPELGGAPSVLPNAKAVTPYELASRLSSLVWASIPDDALLDAAGTNHLATREQVAAEARRMLDDPRARPALLAFYDQWLGTPMLGAATKDPKVYPAWNDELRSSMQEETRRFVGSVLWDGDRRLTTLLTAPYSFVNAPLAKLYGVSGPADATTFTRVAFNPRERAGILTQASVLAAFAAPNESSPIKRGKWVRTRMLCQDLPDPPPNIPAAPPPMAGLSNRDRLAAHAANPACNSCHHLIDGLGTGLERYDGIGAYRTLDQGVAVDARGEVVESADIDGAYDGGPELAALLAKSTQVRDCAATQYLRHALARREGPDDACSVAAVRDSFARSGGDLRELVVALTQTDAFWNVRPAEQE